MPAWPLALPVGLVSGMLAGMFGIGGGILTTPGLRILLGTPALVAVGTPLVAIVPAALTAARAHARHGNAQLRTGVLAGSAGALAAAAGASVAHLVGGSVVLLATAALIFWAAVDVISERPYRTRRAATGGGGAPSQRRSLIATLIIGVLAGAYAGLFGLGGGLVLVPLLSRWLRLPIKCAIGTSLVAMPFLVVPGLVAHAALGHVDWALGAALTAGAVPGSLAGARLGSAAREGAVRVGFAAVLFALGVLLAAGELRSMLR